MKPSLLQALRGEVSRDQLAPDSPPCYDFDLLSAEEVASLRRCSISQVYAWRKRGVLRGTPAEPYHFFGWSVLQVMGWGRPPEPEPAPAPTPVLRPVPAPAPARRTPPQAVRGLRHLRVPPRGA